MSVNKIKDSATFLVNNYNTNLSIDFVHQIVQLKCVFEDKILKLNSVNDLVKFLIVYNYLISANFPVGMYGLLSFLIVATAE